MLLILICQEGKEGSRTEWTPKQKVKDISSKHRGIQAAYISAYNFKGQLQNCNNVYCYSWNQDRTLYINKERRGRKHVEIYAETHTHIHTRKQIMVMVNSELAGLIASCNDYHSRCHTENTAETPSSSSSSSLHSSRDTGQGGVLGDVTDWGKVWWEGMWWYHVTMQSAFLTGPGKHRWGGRGHPVRLPPLTPPSTAASHSPNIWRSLVV